MPRFRRLVVPGYPHHVTQRGVRRQQTFFDARDYRTYLDLAAEELEKVDLRISAYCLMPNHVHAIVIPDDRQSLSKFFANVHHRYAMKINARKGWAGHLWQERFYSVVMDETHLLMGMRYVELNPVRSGLCRRPQDWPWSSARAHLDECLDPLVHDVSPFELIDDWSAYLSDGDDEERLREIRDQTRTGRPSGRDTFIDDIEARSGRTVRRNPGGRPKKLGH
ncbi:MAG: transposase [Pseudomonadota bacterium]